jgi:hypothetical protein
MPRVGFEPTIPVFEQAKTVHALERGHCGRRDHYYYYLWGGTESLGI